MTQRHLRRAAAAAARRAAVRADARDVCRRAALRRAVAGRQRQRLDRAARRRSRRCSGMGLSGLPFVGSDIGGFAEAPSAGALHALAADAASSIRSCARTRRSARPTRSRGRTAPRHEAINRRAIELRYELLPHIYNVMHEVERDRAAGDAAAAARVSRRPAHLRHWTTSSCSAATCWSRRCCARARRERERLPAEGRRGSTSGPAGATTAARGIAHARDARDRSRSSCAAARSSSGSRSCSTPARCRASRSTSRSIRPTAARRRSTKTTA